MYAESHFATDRYKEIEEWYFNATGVKSKAILSCHCADENGSWLRQFNSWAEYYRITLTMFKDYYWDSGLNTPKRVSAKWIGKYSENWISSVTKIMNEVNKTKKT